MIQTFQLVENPHKANKALTEAILQADKLYIPKGKIQPTRKHQLLPQNIKDSIKHRDNIRKQNPTYHVLDQLNRDIDKAIIQYKTDEWKKHLDSFDNKDSRKLWQTISKLSNKKNYAQVNRSITFNNKEKITSKEKAEAFNKQFTNTTKHQTDKQNRIIDRNIRKLTPQNIHLTKRQIKAAIKNSKNNNSTGPDNIKIKHLKHLGTRALSST